MPNIQTGISDHFQCLRPLSHLSHLASTSISTQLNTLSYPQKCAVRALIEMLLLPEKPDAAYKILEDVPWLADLGKEDAHGHPAAENADTQHEDDTTDEESSSNSDEDDLQTDEEYTENTYLQSSVFIVETTGDMSEDIVMVEVEA
ncbi:hypothetical protein VNI00_017908 [Paramarasmius palmivorus]|uniref:Uncharacterized protein n=1 Tax=Paramarasmius palmivorus TaxID=297713 RepID=A0AAW0B4H4_9AGAR